MSDVRKVEITEEKVIIFGIAYYAGDVKSFPKEQADEFIRVGWAKCVETGEANERSPGAQTLQVDDVSSVVA